MFDIAYEAEVSIEAAKIIIDREWEKSKQIKTSNGRALYLGLACFRAANAREYWEIIFNTHGGC